MDVKNSALSILGTLIKGASVTCSDIKEALKDIDILICKNCINSTDISAEDLEVTLYLLIFISNLIHSPEANIHNPDKILLVKNRPELLEVVCNKRIKYYG